MGALVPNVSLPEAGEAPPFWIVKLFLLFLCQDFKNFGL